LKFGRLEIGEMVRCLTDETKKTKFRLIRFTFGAVIAELTRKHR